MLQRAGERTSASALHRNAVRRTREKRRVKLMAALQCGAVRCGTVRWCGACGEVAERVEQQLLHVALLLVGVKKSRSRRAAPPVRC